MPFVNANQIIIEDETKEMQNILEKNQEAREALEQFESECKLRRTLADARKHEGITQTEIQEKTGLTQQVISRIEKDYEISPSLRNLIKYVNAIGYELTLQPKQKQ